MSAGVATAADWPAVADLRRRVFVLEQGVPADVGEEYEEAGIAHVTMRRRR